MNETYIWVGSEASWIIAFMPEPAIIRQKLVARKKGLSAKLSWREIVVVLFCFEAAYLGLPMEWMFQIALLAMIPWIFFDKSSSWKLLPRLILSAVLVFAAASYSFINQKIRDPIALDEQELKFEEFRGPRKLRRDGMTVHSYGGPRKFVFEIRTSQQWSFRNGKEYGPDIMGPEVYWGPDGLIRGDDLAMHIASWANTSPIVDPLISDEELDSNAKVSVRSSVHGPEDRTIKG